MSAVARGRQGRRIGIAAIAFLALAPAGAVAGTPGISQSLGKSKGLEYFKATYVSVVSQTSQPVTCDSGEVSGGGGSITGSSETSALNESYPIGETGWQAEASTTGEAEVLTGYAICDPDGGFDYETDQASLNSNSALFNGSLCGSPGGPIGGGGGATGSGSRLIASVPLVPPSDTGWSAAGLNPTQDDTLWTTYSICGDTTNVKYRESKPTKLKPGEEGKATAKCKSNEAVMSGGLNGIAIGSEGWWILPSVLKPWDSKDKRKTPDDGWQARAFNSETRNVNLVSLAICRKP